MKKTILILAAAAALAVSCKVEEILQDEIITSTAEGGYSFDFSVNGGGFGAETKADATVGWTRGESIFVFFQPEGEALLDSYLSLTFDGSEFVQGGSSVRIGTLGEGGKLSAVYVPYLKSGVKPVYSEGSWTINAGDVYYSCATEVSYTVEDSNVSATIDMHIPDGYVQFAAPASKADEGDKLSCNMVDAFSCVTLGSDLSFSAAPVEGKEMTGHKDGEKVYFWGKKNGATPEKCDLTLASVTHGNFKKSVAASSLAANNAYATDFIPVEALPGLFSISPTEKVHFSKGNLYCTRSGSEDDYSYSLDMENKQYEFHTRYDVKHLSGKSSRSMLDPEEIPGLIYKDGESGLFQWMSETAFLNHELKVGGLIDDFFVPSQAEVDLAHKSYGAFSSLPFHETCTELDGLPTDNVDLGKYYGDGKIWFTLSADEWQYLIGKREYKDYATGTTAEVTIVESPSRDNADKLCNFPVTVNGVKGLLIAPDDWNFSDNPITGDGAVTEYNDEEWTAAENSGLAFLPSVDGNYAPSDKKITYFGQSGGYWARTAYDGTDPEDYYMAQSYAYALHIYHESPMVRRRLRSSAYPVRLVCF